MLSQCTLNPNVILEFLVACNANCAAKLKEEKERISFDVMATLLPSEDFLMTHGVPAVKKNFTRSRKCNCISATLALADVIFGHVVIFSH